MKCRICSAMSTCFLFNKNNYERRQCSVCQTVFVANIPSEEAMADLYKLDLFFDYQKHSNRKNVEATAPYLNARKKLRLITKHISKGALLDVGCATGFFMLAARQYYEVFGIDISEDAINIAKKRFRLNAQAGDFLTSHYTKKFDVVTMFDTLEHVIEPGAYLHQVHRILRANGFFVFSTPDINSILYKINKKNWHLMVPPRHLYLFSSETIESILHDYGFSNVEILKLGQYTNLHYAFDKISNIAESYLLKHTAGFLAGVPISKNLNPYLNLKDVMTVICTRS